MNRKAELERIAGQVRAFLEPRWQVWHEASGRAIPQPPSRFTCGRSSLFLCRVLGDAGWPARWVNGTPRTEPEGPLLGPWGFLAATGWQAHAWAEAGGWILDVTADQFGAPPVIVTPRGDARYGEGPQDTALPAAVAARQRTLEETWRAWVAAA